MHVQLSSEVTVLFLFVSFEPSSTSIVLYVSRVASDETALYVQVHLSIHCLPFS